MTANENLILRGSLHSFLEVIRNRKDTKLIRVFHYSRRPLSASDGTNIFVCVYLSVDIDIDIETCAQEIVSVCLSVIVVFSRSCNFR